MSSIPPPGTRAGRGRREPPRPVARIRINPIACEAHGMCVELLPELIRLDDWGYPIIDEPAVDASMLALARRAADACPTLALLVDEE